MRNLFLLSVLLICFSARSQVDSVAYKTQLETLTLSSLHVNDSVMKAPAAVTVLSAKALQRGDATDISTVMNRVAGVLMQSGALNTNRISIRGIGARTPFGTNKIRAFYGNIPLTSGDGETTIEDLDLQSLSKAEIIKGPLSSIYGAGLGGAILLSPGIEDRSGTFASARSTFGSYGLSKFSANVASANESASVNFNYHTLDADGWRQNSKYHREGETLSGELFRNGKNKLTYLANHTYLKAYIPSSINKQTFDNNPRAAAPTWLASKGFEQYDSYLAGLDYDLSIGKIRNETSVFLNAKNSNEPRPFDILRENTLGYGARTQFSGNFNWLHGGFILGGEYFGDRFKSRNYENLYQQNNGDGSLQGDKLAEAKQHRSFYNLFGQIRLHPLKKIEFQAGVNLNQTKFSLDNTFPSQNTSSQNYGYDAIWSPQASALYIPNVNHTVYFSASRGFSLPSVEETLTASGTINTTIKPESGTNIELGAKNYFLGRQLYVEIALYNMEIKDLLVAKRIGDDQYVGVNAGRTTHRGVELSGQYQCGFSTDWTLEAYFSGSYGEYVFRDFTDSGNDFTGNKLPGVPQLKTATGFILSWMKWYFSTDFSTVGKMQLNDANSGSSDAYKLANIEAGWKWKPLPALESRFSVGINNALNEKYASMILVNATGVGNAAPRYYYPGMPANVYANVAINYIF